jgi:hypothetical protein
MEGSGLHRARVVRVGVSVAFAEHGDLHVAQPVQATLAQTATVAVSWVVLLATRVLEPQAQLEVYIDCAFVLGGLRRDLPQGGMWKQMFKHVSVKELEITSHKTKAHRTGH